MRIVAILSIWLIGFNLYAQSTRILIDGNFEDWENISPVFEDTPNDGSFTNIDFNTLKVSHDDDFLYLYLTIGTELNLQDINDIKVYIDTDNTSTSGENFRGIGAELVFNFGERQGEINFNNSTFSVEHSNIGLQTSPTVTSQIFEIAISRNIEVFGELVFNNNAIRIALEDEVFDGDILPNDLGGVVYEFQNTELPPLPTFDFKKQDEAAFRVVSYNVLRDDLFENETQDEYNRIFKLIEPQIIGFQEIYDHTSAETADQVETYLPSSFGETWYHDRVSPDIICVSRYPILQSFVIDGVSSSQNNGAFLIDMPAPFNGELLFIVAHTPCCSNNAGRQQEIDAIMGFIRDAQLGDDVLQLNSETPIIIVGDMNLVGDAQNYQTLLTGDIDWESQFGPDFKPDWDGTDLEDALPYATNTAFNFTWFNPFSSFYPGKLDVILYTGSVLEKTNAYSLFSPGLNNEQLSTTGLVATDTRFASDHLPVVADFKIKEPVAVYEIGANHPIQLNSIFPNPIEDQFQLSFQLTQTATIQIQIADNSGKNLQHLFKGTLLRGDHQLNFSEIQLPSGFYTIRIQDDRGHFIAKKIIIQ